MPACRAIASAVARRSPLNMTIRSPRRFSDCTTVAALGRNVSAIANAAAALPSIAANTTVRACDVHVAAVASSADVSTPDSRSSACGADDHVAAIDIRQDASSGDRHESCRPRSGRLPPAHARRWPSRADAPIAARRPPPGGGSSRDRRRRAYRPPSAGLRSACRSCRRRRYRRRPAARGVHRP